MANILYLSIFSLISFFHPIHISVTEIEHDEKSRSLEMVMRVFIDDFEMAIRNDVGKSDLDITNPGAEFTTDQLVENYIRKHFKVEVNGKNQDYKYLGHEVELPVMYLYIEASGVKKLNDLSIQNTIILDEYDDQANLVHVKANGETQSLKLNEDNKKEKLTF